MTVDAELNGGREAWQAQRLSKPEVHTAGMALETATDMARPHAEFLDDAIRRMRFRFWKWPERNFLTDVAYGRGLRRRRKAKGGLNV
jgi:hypothetical protein